MVAFFLSCSWWDDFSLEIEGDQENWLNTEDLKKKATDTLGGKLIIVGTT